VTLELIGSVIKEQGVTFAVVLVKKHVIDNISEADNLIQALRIQIFQGMPVVLMAENSGRIQTYGRNDIAKFLANINPRRIPWKKYWIN
jgi:hypothetical protein